MCLWGQQLLYSKWPKMKWKHVNKKLSHNVWHFWPPPIPSSGEHQPKLFPLKMLVVWCNDWGITHKKLRSSTVRCVYRFPTLVSQTDSMCVYAPHFTLHLYTITLKWVWYWYESVKKNCVKWRCSSKRYVHLCGGMGYMHHPTDSWRLR